MSGDELAGVVFPTSADGRRSTSALGRAVTADALRAADPAGALDAERDTNWRTGYVAHFRLLVEAGLPSRKAAVSVARDGLESLHRRMRVADAGGGETGLDTLLSAPGHRRVTTVTVPGTGPPGDGLSLPYRGGQLRGDALARRLDAWVDDGVIEPSCADAIRTVAAHPEWLRLPGRTIAMLGAGTEVGPLAPLLGWGARVIAVDLPRPAIWERILDTARRSAGTLLVPVAAQQAARAGPGAGVRPSRSGPAWTWPATSPMSPTGSAPWTGRWCWATTSTRTAPPTCACPPRSNALTVRLQAGRGDTALAFLATPTDVFAVPPEAVAQSARAYAARSRAAKVAAGPCGRCPAAACSAAPTCPGSTRASTTAWSASKVPTMRWPSGCTAGAPHSPVTPARPCR